MRWLCFTLALCVCGVCGVPLRAGGGEPGTKQLWSRLPRDQRKLWLSNEPLKRAKMITVYHTVALSIDRARKMAAVMSKADGADIVARIDALISGAESELEKRRRAKDGRGHAEADASSPLSSRNRKNQKQQVDTADEMAADVEKVRNGSTIHGGCCLGAGARATRGSCVFD